MNIFILFKMLPLSPLYIFIFLQITVGSVYKVRWGKANHVDEAVVVEMGTYSTMQ